MCDSEDVTKAENTIEQVIYTALRCRTYDLNLCSVNINYYMKGTRRMTVTETDLFVLSLQTKYFPRKSVVHTTQFRVSREAGILELCLFLLGQYA